jgi:hypothetical protein
MIKRSALVLALCPGAVSAEMHEQLFSGFLVDDIVHCEQMVDVDLELHVWNVVQAGGSTLGAWGTASPELDCWFEEEIEFSWSAPSTQLRLAACYVADRVQPIVFAIEMFPEAPGMVQVWEQGVDEPMTFEVCEAPG